MKASSGAVRDGDRSAGSMNCRHWYTTMQILRGCNSGVGALGEAPSTDGGLGPQSTIYVCVVYLCEITCRIHPDTLVNF